MLDVACIVVEENVAEYRAIPLKNPLIDRYLFKSVQILSLVYTKTF